MVGLGLGISEPSVSVSHERFRSQENHFDPWKGGKTTPQFAQVTNRTHNKTEEKEDKGDEKAPKKFQAWEKC